MKKIVFDIDEVVRDLGIIIHKKFNIPSSLRRVWWDTYKGLNFYDWVAKDYSILYKAKPTKYYNAIKSFYNGSKIEFWTHQPMIWRPYTIKWLKKYFGNNFKVRFLDREQKYQRLCKYKNVLLVEDSPFFPTYNRIILLDTPYNRLIKTKYRIKNVIELKQLLNKINDRKI